MRSIAAQLVGIASLVALATACEAGSLLTVDLVTDLHPSREVDVARVDVLEDLGLAASPIRTETTSLDEADDALSGLRVAELDGLARRTYVVRVRLQRGGAEVAEGLTLAELTGSALAVTVRVTRDCAGVSCPMDGDEPAAIACVGGRCVDPRCSPESPGACPDPECATDDACAADPSLPACARGVCLGGVCASYLDDARCGGGICAPDVGCESAMDGGFDRDASAADASVDAASLDAGVPIYATQLAAGGHHTCGIQPTGETICWGSNTSGELGDGTRTDSPLPVVVSGLTDAVEVRAGGVHSCARRASGEVVCWGGNAYGQLGDGTNTQSSVPVAVVGLPAVTQLALGEEFSCALSVAGEVWCWGRNRYGQLGDGTTMSRATPARVVGLSDATSIGTGLWHGCGYRAVSGDIACWGWGAEGQLGDGTFGASGTTTVTVVGSTGALDVAVGGRHDCARFASGAVECWGEGTSAQLADGSGMNQGTPVMARGITASDSLGLGDRHSCAVVGGEVYCWGLNQDDQLGDGSSSNRSMPVRALTLSDAIEVVGGSRHTCARRTGNLVTCWGINDHGELGNGTITP
ncbi:MAG: RCC1 domain-containing protein [Sandaracinaceae bacterium]